MPKSKSKKAKAKKTAKPKKAPIPPGFHTVTPYLTINGAAAAIDWYKKAFGARELARDAIPDGKIMNARIRIGDSIVMLSDTFPGGGPQSLTCSATAPSHSTSTPAISRRSGSKPSTQAPRSQCHWTTSSGANATAN